MSAQLKALSMHGWAGNSWDFECLQQEWLWWIKHAAATLRVHRITHLTLEAALTGEMSSKAPRRLSAGLPYVEVVTFQTAAPRSSQPVVGLDAVMGKSHACVLGYMGGRDDDEDSDSDSETEREEEDEGSSSDDSSSGSSRGGTSSSCGAGTAFLPFPCLRDLHVGESVALVTGLELLDRYCTSRPALQLISGAEFWIRKECLTQPVAIQPCSEWTSLVVASSCISLLDGSEGASTLHVQLRFHQISTLARFVMCSCHLGMRLAKEKGQVFLLLAAWWAMQG